MNAEFLKQEGAYALFRRNEQTARLPLAAAYSAYLCSPDGHLATDPVGTWAVIAALPGEGPSDALHVAVLPNGAQQRQLPHWFGHASTTVMLPTKGVWLTTHGQKSKLDSEKEVLLREAEVEAQINQRAQLLQNDTAEAETTDGSRTLDAYIRCRVKRALHVINCINLRDTVAQADAARQKMQHVLLAHARLMPPDHVVATQSLQFDTYTPEPADYNFVVQNGPACDTNGDELHQHHGYR